uniref:Uncharacterized protein n=1 Tax=Chrysotila carterae TaxID=13221 RepID=A0A7S4B952_CHRCT
MARNALTILSMLGAAEALTTGVVLRAPKVRTARLTMQDAAAPAEAAEEEAVPPPPPPPPPVEYSQSMPFLVKRKALNGYVGDVGFDPLGFSEILPMVRTSFRQAVRTARRLLAQPDPVLNVLRTP